MSETFTLVAGTLVIVIITFVVLAFAYFIQRKLIQKERDYREIEQLLQSQELKSIYSLMDGQEQERKRIASDIHDSVGSMLATLKIYSDLVLDKEQNEEVLRLNNKINEIAENLTNEIRKIAHNLDSNVLRDFGLKAAISQLCEAINNSGKIQLNPIIDLQYTIDGESSLQIYRIVQELFTNTLKHSEATLMRFEITQVNGDISLIHEDNGVGFNVEAQPSGSMGLQNIRSRIKRLNGELKIQSSSLGSTFIIEIPMST